MQNNFWVRVSIEHSKVSVIAEALSDRKLIFRETFFDQQDTNTPCWARKHCWPPFSVNLVLAMSQQAEMQSSHGPTLRLTYAHLLADRLHW